jgi:hypothetical protein
MALACDCDKTTGLRRQERRLERMNWAALMAETA